jgi:hypothetical protein
MALFHFLSPALLSHTPSLIPAARLTPAAFASLLFSRGFRLLLDPRLSLLLSTDRPLACLRWLVEGLYWLPHGDR